MMKPGFRYTAMRFVIAGSALIQCSPEGGAVNGEVSAMFIFGLAENAEAMHRDLAESARASKMSIVCLEFEKGDARSGPSNITVFEYDDGAVLTWEKCSFWSASSAPIGRLVPAGKPFSFLYDGAHLRKVNSAPAEDLMDGVKRAKIVLKRMAARVPREVLMGQVATTLN